MAIWIRYRNNYKKIPGSPDIAILLKQSYNDYMGMVFEEICTQYMWKCYKNETLPINLTDMGRWWGNNPKKKAEQEIDILAFNKNEAVFGECKWRNEFVDAGDYAALKGKAEMFKYKRKYNYLFSKSGFTKEVHEIAKKDERIRLISIEEMVLCIKKGCSIKWSTQ